MITRRHALGAGVAAGVSATSSDSRAQDDEAFWRDVRAAYDLPEGIINLENGNWGVMARPVLRAFERHTQRVNTQASYYARRAYYEDFSAARSRIAAALGVGADEIAITRGATEALQILIGGYNRLSPGDAALFADLDYDSMQTAMRSLRQRRGVSVVEMAVPEPATRETIVRAYENALQANPRIKLVLATALSHRTGLAPPIAEIVALARRHGADVIVDAAHAWGQCDIAVPDLGADFVGLNLHKWIGAPIGVGVLYIKRTRIADIDPFMGEPEGGSPIDARVHTGTMNFAAVLSVPDALDWREHIGAARFAARLKTLRRIWVDEVRTVDGVEILTPLDDPALSAGMTSFRLRGQTSVAANQLLAQSILRNDGIFLVHRAGVAAGACVRVTPHVFNTPQDMAALARAVRRAAAG